MSRTRRTTEEQIPFPRYKDAKHWMSIGSDTHVYRDDDMWRVMHGTAVLYEGTMDDVVTKKLCMVQLGCHGLATEREIAKAFGCSRGTVTRAKAAFLRDGAEGLAPKKPGPKGARLERGIEQKIVRLRREGKSVGKIAHTLSVPWSTTSRACKRHGLGERRDQQRLAFDANEGARHAEDAEPESEAVEGVGEEITQEQMEGAGEEPSEKTVENDLDSVAQELASRQPCIEVEPGEPAPVRDLERVLARFGKLGKPEVDPEFVSGTEVPAAGVLLAMALVSGDGILEIVRKVYGVLRDGFYGLRSIALTLLFSAWLGIETIDDHQHGTPHVWGRVLGLDRLPETKTIRRKLKEIVPRKLARTFMSKMAEHRINSGKSTIAVLYVDGHVREYHGKHRVSKRYVSRLGKAKPAIEDYWLHDETFSPILKVTAKPGSSLVSVIPQIMENVREWIGDDRELTVVFDRAGWSPKSFIELLGKNVRVVTYRKNKKRTYPLSEFDREVSLPDRADGTPKPYQVRDRFTSIDGYWFRSVTVLGTNNHQTEIITNDETSATEVILSEMFSRWGQENFFKYDGEHRSLNRLHSYSFELVPDDVEVPNPAHRELDKQVKRAEVRLNKLETESDNSQSPDQAAARLNQLKWWRGRVAALKAKRRNTPKQIRAGDLPENERPEQPCDEIKLFTDVFDMSATHIEKRLLGMLSKHYKSSYKDGRQLLRQIFSNVGDLAVEGNVLTVTLNALASPHQTAALSGLCEEVNALNPTFPETTLSLRFRVHDHP